MQAVNVLFQEPNDFIVSIISEKGDTRGEGHFVCLPRCVVKCLGETLNTVWCHIMHFNKDQKTDASHLFTHRDTHRYTHNRPERGEADVKVPFTTTPSASLARSLYIVPAKLLTT